MTDIQNKRWEEKKQMLLQFLKEHPVSSATIFSALSIPVKHAGYFALLPENLDLEAHIRQYPLADYKFIDWYGRVRSVNRNGSLGSYFDIERMIHLIGLITSAWSDNKDEIDESSYVPIHSRRIRYYFKDYESYLDYLIVTGIIVCDRQYIVGERPRLYKLDTKYEDVPLKPYYYVYFNQIPVTFIDEEVYNKETESFERNTLLDKEYLYKWYEQKKIEIHCCAERYAYNVMRIKQNLGYSHWDLSDKLDENYYPKRKNPKLQYDAVMQNINEIKIHHYKAKIDTNVHRLNSVLTNMQKEFRNFLTYDGQELVAIDIKNSQPYLLCLLLKKEFWMENSILTININNLPPNIQRLYNIPPEIISNIREFFESINETDFQGYINIVARGRLYEMIVEIGKLLNKKSQITREKAKKNLLIFFYSANKDDIEGNPRRKYIIEKVFEKKFPTIMELIRLIKKDYEYTELNNTYNRFALLLQSLENEIVLNRCCKRIWDETNHQIPVFTIHDSIVTTIEHQDFVKHIMEEELTRAIGITPSLKIEDWREEELDQEILSQIRT